MSDWFAELFSALTVWVSANAVWIAILSVAYFLVSLFVIRHLIIRIPTDYFLDGPGVQEQGRHTFVSVGVRIGKNLLGIIIIIVGLVMSVPGVAGQGVLTILLGLSLTDFPGKRRLELRLVSQPILLKAVNGIREKAGKPPLLIPGGRGKDPGRDRADSSSHA